MRFSLPRRSFFEVRLRYRQSQRLLFYPHFLSKTRALKMVASKGSFLLGIHVDQSKANSPVFPGERRRN